MSSIPEAFRGAQVQLAQTGSLSSKLRLLATYAKIFAGELVGTVFLIPYGWRSLRLHQTLPNLSKHRVTAQKAGVYLCRDVRYGPRTRNTMDIYVPAKAWDTHFSDEVDSSAEDAPSHHVPVAFFCHGGVWAAGEKWQYSPMATRLAQEGILTCVLQYSLYPQALVPQMVEEVSSALTWTLDHAASYGGAPTAVNMIGHSAGAQLCMMALLHRAAGKRQEKAAHASRSKDTFANKRMPAKFIGMAGAYDIATHYGYEKGRGVEYLSTMARAIGGCTQFASQSPAVILQRSADAHGLGTLEASPVGTYHTSADELQGRGSTAGAKVSGSGMLGTSLTAAAPPSDISAAVASSGSDNVEVDSQPVLQLSPAELKRLPPSFLMSSKADVTVPWTQSEALYKQLRRCGNRVDNLVYTGIKHADFVIKWRPTHLVSSVGTMPEFAADIVQLLKIP